MDVTVGQAKTAIAFASGQDFSDVDWNEVRSLLISMGLYTPEVAEIIDQFVSGDLSSLYSGLAFASTIVNLYPDDMSLAAAIDDYTSKNYIDYTDYLPDTPPPPEMDWGSTASEAESDTLTYDPSTGEWVAEGIDQASEWAHDSLKEFAIGKITGGFWEHANEFIDAMGSRFGVARLHQQVKEAQGLYNKVTNFHTNVMDAITDALDGKITIEEFDERIDSATGQFQSDISGVGDATEAALDSFQEGALEYLDGDADEGEGFVPFSAGAQAAAAASNGEQSFRFKYGNGSTFLGTEGRDGLVGGRSAETIDGKGGNDIVVGRSGNDNLRGGTGDDSVLGGEGDDRLVGGADADEMWGGGGSDTFVWGDGDGTDTLADFQPNVDKVDLTGASGIFGFGDLTLDDQGSNVFIGLGGGGGILIIGREPGQLDAGDFIFAEGGDAAVHNNDIDGDGRSDIVFRNPTTGQQSLWEMNGAVTEAATKFGGKVDAAWHLLTLADFDGDGKGDLLWRHDNGTVTVWEMNGPVLEAKDTVAKNFNAAWHINGTGDFNGDRNADLLWRHDDGSVSIWEMDGGSVLAKPSVVKRFDLNWHIVAADDFDGDGNDDLLWRNDDTGKSSLWRMDGADVLSKRNVAGSPGLDWHLADTGDFNGDGRADLLWRQDGGKISIWSMNGATALSKNTVANLSTVWENADVGDYNGDGNDDMLFRNQNTGAVSVWEMDGATVLDKLSAGKVGIDWHVVGDSFDLV